MIEVPAHLRQAGAIALLALLCGTAPAADNGFVAGLTPDRRPAQPPRTAKIEQPANALFGVATPVPGSIGNFMKDQGAWYTPFTHPGMVGYYDIRGWHANREIAARPAR